MRRSPGDYPEVITRGYQGVIGGYQGVIRELSEGNRETPKRDTEKREKVRRASNEGKR